MKSSFSNKIILTPLIFIFCIFFQSCNPISKDKIKVTVESFFLAYREGDFYSLFPIYPDIAKLKGSFRKSTSIDLDTKDISIVNDSTIIVSVTHHWVNPYGVDNPTKMKFYMTKKGEKYIILDSKNFCIYDDDELYNFACKTGAIKSWCDTTDLSISEKISDVKSMYDLAKTHVKHTITSGLSVNKGWKWESGYSGDYATGKAIVSNNTSFPIRKPKYKITYFKSDNKTVVTTDDGIVCYDVLMPGQSKSFSWYTSYIGNAQYAKISIEYDDEEWIEEIIMNLPFIGSEYYMFKHNIDWWPSNY